MTLSPGQFSRREGAETSEIPAHIIFRALIVPKSNTEVTESIRFIDSVSIEDVRKNSALATR